MNTADSIFMACDGSAYTDTTFARSFATYQRSPPYAEPCPAAKTTVVQFSLQLVGHCPSDAAAAAIGQSMVASVPAGIFGTYTYRGCTETNVTTTPKQRRRELLAAAVRMRGTRR